MSQFNLRQILQRQTLDVFVGAHDPLSALMIQQAGLTGVWASSLTITCANGYRDTNEMSLSEMMTILENMTRRLDVPLIFDADTGYGEFHHTQLLVERAIRRQVAGICIEDKMSPKMNSFYAPDKQRLEPVDAFCGKLRAAKVARDRVADGPLIIARTESLVIGAGVDVALERANAYANAGADAILIHSKSKSFDEVEAFASRWDSDLPLICVPTTYATTSLERMQAAGISVIIWANHPLRAAVSAMESALQHIAQTKTVANMDQSLASVRQLFDLQDLSSFVSDIELFAPHLLED